jgi:hypothetical protein
VVAADPDRIEDHVAVDAPHLDFGHGSRSWAAGLVAVTVVDSRFSPQRLKGMKQHKENFVILRGFVPWC